MKRRNVMRLLAMVIAASVAVTSPTLPASLTTVYAEGELAMTGTAVIQNDSATLDAGKLIVGATLSIADLTAPDEGLSYQWKADNVNIEGANDATFVLTKNQVGAKISVDISATGYITQSPDTGDLKVANKYAVTSVSGGASKQITASVTSGSGTSKYEYSLDGGESWNDPAAGDTESAGTLTIAVPDVGGLAYAYAKENIKVRVKDTEDSKVDTAVTSTSDLTADLAGTVSLEVKRSGSKVTDAIKVGDEITATVSGAQTRKLTYTFKKATTTGTVLAENTTGVYTVASGAVGEAITVDVKATDGSLYTGTGFSATTTKTVEKAPALALAKADVKPAEPTAIVTNEKNTKYTYAMTTTDGTILYQRTEGSAAAATWEDSMTTYSWDDCEPGKTYTFYAVRKSDEGHLQGTDVVSWQVTFPKLKHDTLTLSYKVENDGESDRLVTITKVAGAQYKFDKGTYSSTNTKKYEGAQSSSAEAVVYIRYEASDVFESQGDELSETIADVSLTQATAPTAVELKFEPDTETNKYKLTITPTYTGDGTLEYSTDGKTFNTKEALEGAAYNPGTSIVVYARVKATGTNLASESVASTKTTTPAALATPVISKNGNMVTIEKGDSDTEAIYYTTDGSTPTKDDKLLYSEPFTITVPAVVKAVAYKEGRVLSAVKVISYVATTTTTTTDKDNTTADDTKTETSVEETTTETNAAGKEVTTTTTTKMDEDGNVTGITEVSEIADVAKNTTATVTVTKDGGETITSATAAVTKTVVDTNKVSITGAVVSQITEAAGTTDVKVTVTVKGTDGKKKYTVLADADELTAGNDLYIYQYKVSTGEYVMVNAKTYTVSAKGTVSVSMTEKKTYELVTAAEAKAIEKQIKATVKVKKSSASVKKGKTTTIALASGVNKNNIKKITYTTGKKSVATVNKNGKITAKKKGTATIKATVTLKNGSTKTVKMTVKVK
jgi:hypothetical protein